MDMVMANTVLAVGIMLAGAVLGSTLALSFICSKTLESMARQPEMRPQLMTSTFIFVGLVEAFPFIVLAVSLLLLFANPFVSA